MIIIEPSILSADFARLGEAAKEAEVAGVRAIQIDVMDGRFVPNINFGPGVVSALRPLVKITLDVHLMIVNPGFGGQKFIHSQLDKIRRLRRILNERNSHIPIAVDGGVDTTTAPLVVNAGATVLVAGSSVYNSSGTVAENVNALIKSIHL